MPSLGAYGWLKGETTDPNDAAAGGKTGEGVKNVERVEERIRDFSRPYLRTCTWLRTWQCHYRLLVVILVKYCNPRLAGS